MKSVVNMFRMCGVLVAVSVVLLSCSNQFSSEPGVPVTITPTLNGKALPEGIDSIELNVTGPGMEQIEESIEFGENSVTIEVPSGEEREFNIDITTAMVTFSGSAVEDLTAGEDEEITIPLDLSEIKMLIPDAMNNRIVKIDDMNGAGWLDTDLGYTVFEPWDIDFDSQGRAYFTIIIDGAFIVSRIGFYSDSPQGIFSAIGDPNYSAISVDRNNDIMYFTYTLAAGGTHLFKSNLDGTNEIELTGDIGVEGIESIKGLEVLDNGKLLIASDSRIDLYDPSGSGQIIDTDNGSYGNNVPFDFIYKNGYAYLSCESSAEIIRFDMSTATPFSNPVDPVIYSANLNMPKRFIRTLSDQIIFIDDGAEKLISIDDIYGTGREDYGEPGPGVGQFMFFLGS